MTKPENPPAFPRPGFEQPAGMQDGMSLRDHFAGMIMAHICGALIGYQGEDRHDSTDFTLEAFDAYRAADAMLAKREVGDGWRPMETAPTDAYVLLRIEGVTHDKGSPEMAVGKKVEGDGWWLTAIWAGGISHIEPSGWMPLPPSGKVGA